ncbi:toxin Cry1Ac domain D-VI-related protein [Peribacillus sp. NJ11]|uniref:toxin Cry1Ac domain D-VI-related protein n=1 Tax=Peribacillus sp. NJ11 TaxID=3055861 RepID=UPI0025A2EA18|nr:toxin Cry1Ac domain D-VI-related protein [Peribacillus sp. NJ11]MDM5219416.1 toxin Cry1Ac domain D-VI-related protein [Peribacillus sp. NJ11]
MKKSKMLRPINVMTTSFLLASSLLMPSAGFAEELSTPKNKDISNAQTSEVKTQEARTQTTETQTPSKAVTKMTANETVVNNFQELKVALEADNGITTIHLGRDIDISGAIKIHPAKSKIVIDGNHHTVTETGATGASGGIYANGNILSSVHVKNLYISGKNYYGFITIHDVTKNVEQIFENVNYNGPQLIWNRYGNAILKGINDIYIQDNAVPGSSITHEMAETGSVEIDGETQISHNSGHALIWSIAKEPQFKIAQNANVKINTRNSGYGIFYATGGDGDFSIGTNAKVEFDGKKGVTGSGMLKSFNVDAGADVQMNRSGTDSYPMISLYGPAQINNQAKLHVTTEDGHALEVENKPSTIDFNNPNNVVLSSIKKQAINNLSTSLTMSMDTSMAKFWTSATGDPTNSYVGKSGGNLTWKAMYRYNVAQSISSSNPENFIIEFTKTKKIELGKNDGGQAEKDLADAKNKVEDLFTDDKFDTLKGTTDQGAIDKAQEAVNKLPEGAEKDRLQDLLNNAKDLLNKKEQAEKDLANAKNKVEDLFTDDKFDTLKGTTDQGAIDKAQEAVNKLPEGAEKGRLQDLLNNAKDLLNKKEQAEKDLANAKNKVEDLFTDDKFDTLKGTTDQGAIDEAKDAVSKLPAGPEKERLEDLLNKAQDLLNKKEQAENDLSDAKNKVEDLFTDDKLDTLKGSTDQGAIDEAKDAVSKLPAGPEKERLEDLLNKAQDLLNKKGQAEKDLNDAKNKVEGLFTDDKFDTLKDTTDQAAIDEAQKAVDKLPAGPEKDRLQDLVTKAEELLNKDITPPAAPKMNSVNTASKELTGTGEPDTKVTVTINGKTYTGVVGPDGKFKIAIPNQPVNAVITVTLTDAAGNVSGSSSVKVVQFMPSEPVKLNTVYPNAEVITGTAPEGATIVRLLVNGEPLRTAPVNEDGTFSIYSKYVGVDENGNNKTLQVGDIVTVDYGIRTPQNLQANTTVVKEVEKLQVNPVAPNADYVTGKAPEGTQNIRLIVNGIAQRTVSHTQTGAGFINPDGSYQFYSRFIVDEIGNSRRLHTGDIIEVDYGALVVGGEVAKTIVK